MRSAPAWTLVALLGCSSGSAATPNDDFSQAPLTTAKSASGDLSFEVRSSPQPPIRGTNDVQLTVTHTADGTPADGLALAVTPWMPAMGHGSAQAAVKPLGGGKYLVSEVYLYMPGLWVLQTTIAGAATGKVDPSVQVP